MGKFGNINKIIDAEKQNQRIKEVLYSKKLFNEGLKHYQESIRQEKIADELFIKSIKILFKHVLEDLEQ